MSEQPLCLAGRFTAVQLVMTRHLARLTCHDTSTYCSTARERCASLADILSSCLDSYAHLRADIIPEHAATLVDAYIEVEGEHIPVHKSLLAMASPIFADAFEAQGMQDSTKPTVPLKDHKLHDILTALNFLYQSSGLRISDPRELLCKSASAAEPVLMFAHKFNMKRVLRSCDDYLSAKAQEDNGRRLFQNDEATIAWASLAERCDLGTLLAHAELHMLTHSSAAFWLNSSFTAHPLSQACFLRIMHVVQANRDACAQEVRRVSHVQCSIGCSANSIRERQLQVYEKYTIKQHFDFGVNHLLQMQKTIGHEQKDSGS